VIRAAAVVVCVTDRHRVLLESLHPDIPSERFTTITNGYDEREWQSIDVDSARRPTDRPVFVITYTGALYQDRSPYPLFRAMRRLGDRGVVDLDRVRIDLIGWCEVAEERSVRAVAEALGIGRCVRIVPPVVREEALRSAAASNLLLLLAESWTLQVPAKTYEYLRSGSPILALTREGALADLLRGVQGAFVVDPVNLEEIERVVAGMYRAWAEGVTWPRRDPREIAGYERRALAARFADLLTSVSRPDAFSLDDGVVESAPREG
jgi:glycosyltransferase involved in cell wall biosynthesis